MDKGQSVCATVSTRRFLILSDEVRKNGKGAINNRTSIAAGLRGGGHIEAAEKVENEARVMKVIAKRNGVKL